MDASGFFHGENAQGGVNSAIPAADGTYVGESVKIFGGWWLVARPGAERG